MDECRITPEGISAVERMALDPGWAPPGLVNDLDAEGRAAIRAVMRQKYGWHLICPGCMRGCARGRDFAHQAGCRVMGVIL